jgi:hypothetical protein
MQPEQVQDLKNAEDIARKFLKWQIPDGALDVVYQLQELLESVLKLDDEADLVSNDQITRHSEDRAGRIIKIEEDGDSSSRFEQARENHEDQQDVKSSPTLHQRLIKQEPNDEMASDKQTIGDSVEIISVYSGSDD